MINNINITHSFPFFSQQSVQIIKHEQKQGFTQFKKLTELNYYRNFYI